MPAPVLATKLFLPPPRPNAILRRRLIARLQAGLHHKLTLVSAAAGFGKTTLLSSWVANCGRPTAWLSLDEGDGDPARFLTYLVAALQTIDATIGDKAATMLQSSQPPIDVLLPMLLNEIAAFPRQALLVLDDYHTIDSLPIHQALAFLVEHLPPQLHLVIATREDPNLPLARLRARGQLTELRAADLRFNHAEAAGFLTEVMGLKLTAGDIAALETRTEGWIAGLQLAALSMQGHPDAAGFIASFTGSHRFVLDYLVEEALNGQPERVQSFLLHTAILDRMCGPLCDAVLGIGDRGAEVGEVRPTPDPRFPIPDSYSQLMLEQLERANLFVVPLDNERRWYRYHHLFAELLRQRLRQRAASRSDAGISAAELHIRASVWYEANGLEADAFHHALAAEDFERAACLAERAWSAMDRSRQAATWLRWVKALPDDVVRSRPVLSAGYAWALLDSGALEAAEARLRDAERWLDMIANVSERHKSPRDQMVVADEEEFRLLPATIAAARAYLAQALGDLPGTVAHARRALDLLPEDDNLRRGIPAALLGLAYWASGELEAAHRCFADAMDRFRIAGNVLFAITGVYILADIRATQGRLHEAVRTYERSLQLAKEQGEPVFRGTADLYAGLSELHCEQGDLATATQYLLLSEELSEQAALPRWKYHWRRAQARIKQAQGDLDGALDLLDEAERLYVRGPVPDVRPIAGLKARVWVAQGRLTEAQRWVRERGLSLDDDLSYMREFEHITLARLLIAQSRSDQAAHLIAGATELLERLLRAAEAGGRMGSVVEILMLQALAHEAQGDVPLALAPISRAMTLAEPEGYVRIFVNEGRPMARLLFEASAHGMLPDYTNKLLAAFDDTTNDERQATASVPSALVEPLSQRELEILHLIAQGLSNREIGELLVLALDTVKGHNRRIYDKLQVQRRTEAVARARELGLL